MDGSTIHRPTRWTTPIAFAPSREIHREREGLLEEAFDFGFGHFFPGGLLGGLPVGARELIGAILDSPGGSVSPVVLGEIPEAILPPRPGSGTPSGSASGVAIPEGFHECIIAGEVRICEDEPFTGDVGVFEPFDPSVVIGDVHDEEPTESQEDDAMAHDWGHLIRETIGGIINPQPTTGINLPPNIVGPMPAPASPGGGFQTGGTMMDVDNANCDPCGPRYLTYDCKTGKFTKKRRRGRRRLATDRDLSDLAAIVAITGKGSAMNQAVAGMVRR